MPTKRINEKTGKPFEPGDIREDGWEFIKFYYNTGDKYFAEKWIPPNVIPIETINPDTKIEFQMYDKRPFKPTADGRTLPQDNTLFARFIYNDKIQRADGNWYYAERWVKPRDCYCEDCKKSFQGTKSTHRFCRVHRTRKLHRTPQRIEEWNRTKKKPCECSISVGLATGCEGRVHHLKDFSESNSKEGDFPYYCKRCKIETRWRTQIRHDYKGHISADDYYWVNHTQGNKCYICGTDEPGLDKEHFFIDHQEKKPYTIRGLLCNSCNTGIGRLDHDTGNLKRAIEYLNNPPFKEVRKILEKKE